jgi:uncharacterized membrane protein
MGRRLARWLLPISLAVNLFFIVVAVRHHALFHGRPPGPHDVVGYLKDNLPAADAAIMQQAFAARAGAMAEAEHAGQRLPDRIRAALTAQPFDAEALRAALVEGRALHQSLEDGMTAAFVEAAGRMSPEGRAKLAAAEIGGRFRHRGPPPPDGAMGPPPGGPGFGPPPGPPPPR